MYGAWLGDVHAEVVGGGGGFVEGGRVLDYQGKTDRQLCRLVMSLMGKFGVNLPAFGDASTSLEEV